MYLSLARAQGSGAIRFLPFPPVQRSAAACKQGNVEGVPANSQQERTYMETFQARANAINLFQSWNPQF